MPVLLRTELVIHEGEAEIVRLIFHWYVYGDENGKPRGVKEIANRLTSMNIPSYGDKLDKGKLRGHGVWTPDQVYPILKRETYRGMWYAYRYKSENGKRVRRPREEWVGVLVPAIISNETWKLAKKKMKEGRAFSKRNNSSHQYLMGCLLSCTCGYRVQGKPSWTRHKTVYLYYRCNGRDRSLTARRCDLPAFLRQKKLIQQCGIGLKKYWADLVSSGRVCLKQRKRLKNSINLFMIDCKLLKN